ncbi:hypothetical protein N9C25_05885 [Saprospiraceae bacterium]|nr:hypothetical protein [Saprospiraceae bacterium]
MKKSLVIFLVAFTATLISAQNDNQSNNNSDQETFNRKGRVLIETGYNLIGGIPIGGGTGLTNIAEKDDSFSGFGFNGGYFLSQSFAIKLSYTNLGDRDSSISSLAIGAKYYIVGKVPIEFSLGALTAGNGDSESIGYSTISVGYGIRLADNINLEPTLGIFAGDEDGIGTFTLNFSMFL